MVCEQVQTRLLGSSSTVTTQACRRVEKLESTKDFTVKLSAYDLSGIRPVRVLKVDGSLSVSPQTLEDESRCIVCLDIIKEAMAVSECLHRFCSNCVQVCLYFLRSCLSLG